MWNEEKINCKRNICNVKKRKKSLFFFNENEKISRYWTHVQLFSNSTKKCWAGEKNIMHNNTYTNSVIKYFTIHRSIKDSNGKTNWFNDNRIQNLTMFKCIITQISQLFLPEIYFSKSWLNLYYSLKIKKKRDC